MLCLFVFTNCKFWNVGILDKRGEGKDESAPGDLLPPRSVSSLPGEQQHLQITWNSFQTIIFQKRDNGISDRSDEISESQTIDYEMLNNEDNVEGEKLLIIRYRCGF